MGLRDVMSMLTVPKILIHSEKVRAGKSIVSRKAWTNKLLGCTAVNTNKLLQHRHFDTAVQRKSRGPTR